MEQHTKKKINYPSFFKIMLNVQNFTSKLEVPPAFVKYLRHKNVSREFTFSLKFGPVGTSWKVAVEKRGCGYCFTRGWSTMAKDLQLAEPDFLVFYLVAEDAFQVAVYDRTCCVKDFPNPVIDLDDEVEDEKEEQEEGQEQEGRASFDVTLAKQNKFNCGLPKEFARKTGLCNMEGVEMEDLAGRKWHIKLVRRKAYYKNPDIEDNWRYELRKGWSEFYKGNGLATGDQLEIEHVGGSMMMLVKKTSSQ